MTTSKPKFSGAKAAANYIEWWIAGALVLAIFAAYWPVAGYAFTDFDDGEYVWQNPQVMKGLSWPGVAWAFTHFHAGNWHPLTWLSHMLDVQLFGTNAGGHHAMSVLFHAANSVLLFLWLNRLTRAIWRSTMVAALFALHPLHVESVAWVAERKDVLSTFFFLLTLLAYTNYAKKLPDQQRQIKSTAVTPLVSRPVFFYALALVFFALGLMSKPMLVTLPFVLLLLDFWPLGRIGNAKMLVWEKTPFFLMSAGSCVVTLFAQRSDHAVMPIAFLPVEARLQNTLVVYAGYLQKMFWPESLAAYYPLHYPIDADKMITAAFTLVLISAGVFIFRRRPYLVVGWLWYLGMLLPVIGLIQVGSQSLADRYTYVTLIGFFIALVWLVADIATEWPNRRLLLAIFSAIVLTACWQLTAAQVRFWQNTETLARHGLDVTTDNALMQGLLGSALFEQGKAEQAGEHFAEAVRIWPDNVTAQCDLALALAAQGRLDEAVAGCEAALKYKPHAPEIHSMLGDLFSRQNKFAEAVEEYKTVLEIQPDNVVDLNNLAWLLATAPDAGVRNGAEAVRLAEKACELSNYQAPLCVGTLAAAYAETGRFDDAVKAAQKAVALTESRKNESLMKKNRELLELYLQKKAYRDQPVIK